MIRLDGKGRPLQQNEDRTELPVLTPDEIAWHKLKEEANRVKMAWWDLWLWRQDTIWLHLATASAKNAAQAQVGVRLHGKKGRPPKPADQKARNAIIIHRVKQYPDQLEKYWPEIQYLIFLELREGKNNLSRSIRMAISKCAENHKAVRKALVQNDKEGFDIAWNQSNHENPGFHGYADQMDRFLVKHWAISQDREWPPFCVWTNEALASFFQEEFKIPALSKRTFEDRISALGLIKCPTKIVSIGFIDNLSKAKIVESMPLQAGLDRIKDSLKAVTKDLVRSAFGYGERAIFPALALLELDKSAKTLTAEVKEELRRMLSPI
jgi:hypothetical protein